MALRMDHVVVLVSELAAATRDYQALGLGAAPGGRHLGFGTENSLIRFDLDYIELLGLRDPDEARSGRFGGETFIATARDGDGLISYALATDDLTGDIERLRKAGIDCSDPFPMRRERPDGVVLEWRLAYPGGPPWGQPLPFLIQWDTHDSVRLPTAPPKHPIGATGIARVVVRADDPAAAAHRYAVLLGQAADEAIHRFALGPLLIDIEPTAGAREGISAIDLTVTDFDAAARFLDAAGARYEHTGNRLAIDPAAAWGARLGLVERH